jgi:Na+/phosphate symporter
MSSVRKYQPLLTYVLKCSELIGVNQENERDESLITLKHMSRVALTFLIVVPFVNFMYHTAYVLTPLDWRARQTSPKLTFLSTSIKASTLHHP